MKPAIATFLYYTGISALCLRLSLLVYGRKHIRIVNYHDTPQRNNALFEQQLKFYRRHYADVSFAELEAFLEKKEWHKPKPGLIISFDDGLRSNYDHAAPLLKAAGFTGWFCVPAAFQQCEAAQQETFTQTHHIGFQQRYSDGRLAMSWDEVRRLGEDGHVIVNHTMHHHRMTEADTEENLHTEVVQSNETIGRYLSQAPQVFCWVGGEEHTYTVPAYRQIRSRFRYAFTSNSAPVFPSTAPHFLNRTNIESFNSVALVQFQLCGAMDAFYYRKRRRVNRKLLYAN